MYEEPKNLLELEVDRLEKKYRGALSKKHMVQELHISMPTLDRYLKDAENIPCYKKLKTGKIVFPISAVAHFLTSGLVQTN